MTQFNLPEGQALRDEGIAVAVAGRPAQLACARSIAYDIASKTPGRTCHADQVQKVLIEKYGIRLGNAAGAIFKGKQWRWSGKITTSARVSNHARILRVWELVS